MEGRDLHDGLLRVVAAANRRRARIARLLGVTDTDVLAIEHLDARGELSPARLADLLDLTSGGMAIVIKRLEEGGHLVRRSHPVDGRRALVRLSNPTSARHRALSDRLSSAIGDDAVRASPGLLVELRRLLDGIACVLEADAEAIALEAAQREPVEEVPRVPSLWQ
jgi:DNA-binding MarR family transcriptional regulator